MPLVRKEGKTKAVRAPRADGEATRARILEAAGELFAASGFVETTSKAIAARAGADMASINYHFGSRDGLYQAVLVEAHRRLLDLADLQRFAQSALPAADKLRMLIDKLIQRATEGGTGWDLTVIAAEALAPSSHFQVLFELEVPMKASVVLSILEDITGIPVDDPALLRCLFSVVTPCVALLIGRRGIPGPIQEVQRMPREVIVEHLHRFAMAGLEAIGSEYARNR
ncbi:MAG: CerR family C-terminal domain-containing protein [Candidatus Accumulibacter sp.]|jgi:AcrR family transcriptional regulator|nr:CerR family C-terminal domain-containing protein [Accumulibacter sp.]